MQKKPSVKNNLYFTHPAIAKEWHTSKNGNLSPKDITQIANRIVWWRCSKDHVWSATINARIRGKGCPNCFDGESEQQSMIQETPYFPEGKVTISEDKAFREKQRGKTSKRELSLETCLQNSHPVLSKEWHPTKNGKLTPQDVTPFSRDNVWWVCSKGHEWKAAVNVRSNGQGCFYCHYMGRRKRS